MYRNLFQNSVQRFCIKYKVEESIRNNRDARLLSSACLGLACGCFQGLPAFLRGGGEAVQCPQGSLQVVIVPLDLIWGAKGRFLKKNWSLPGGSAHFPHM